MRLMPLLRSLEMLLLGLRETELEGDLKYWLISSDPVRDLEESWLDTLFFLEILYLGSFI
jgi:hypothetical protein